MKTKRKVATAAMGIALLVILDSGCLGKPDSKTESITLDQLPESDLKALVVVPKPEEAQPETAAAEVPRKPSGLFVLDSVADLDSLRELLDHNPNPPRKQRISAARIDSLANHVFDQAPVVSKTIDTGACTGAVQVGHVFANGMQVVALDSVPYAISLRGASLGRLGLSEHDSLEAVIARLGPAARRGSGYAVFASTQPDKDQANYCDSRWTLVVKFRDNHLEQILMNFCFEDC